MSKKYIGCTIKQLPDRLTERAAAYACKVNPINRPAVYSFCSVGVEPTAAKIGVLTTKFWGASGVHLTVGFMGKVAAALQEKIVSYMNGWSKYCNVSFTLIGQVAQADVRVSLGRGGYWSYLGTDIRQIPKNQQTMNLEGFSLSTPESEYRRVVYHETGHTLGCPHEHSRAEIIAQLDQAKTIAYFMATQGWSAQDVVTQVLTPISEVSLMGATPHAEQDSIMCYALPGEITLSGHGIVGGTDITLDDARYMGGIYPKSIVPPSPPTNDILITIPAAGTYQLKKVA